MLAGWKWRRGSAGIVLLILALRFASVPTASMSYFLLAAYALLGRAHAIQSLSLSWLLSMLNPGIAPEATYGSLGRHAVVMFAATSVLMRWLKPDVEGFRVGTGVATTLVLGIVIAIHSIIVSPMIDVSMLKAVSWVAAMATIISAWCGLSSDDRDWMIRWIFDGLLLVLICSLPLLATSVGYLRNGTGFQGILNHPQAFGPAMALLGAWSGSQMFAVEKPKWSLVVTVGACLAMIAMSESRTAGISMILGLAVAVATVSIGHGRDWKTVLPGVRSRRVHLLGVVFLIGAVLAAPRIEGFVAHYISKSGRAGSGDLIDAYERSRGGVIQQMVENIQESPLAGIGFGIASHVEDMEVGRDPILGLPVSASIEKGVLPVAVVEELGMFGASAFLAWLVVLMGRAIRGGVAPAAISITALLLNMGESTFFSPGGFGMLVIVLMGWAFSSGQDRRAV